MNKQFVKISIQMLTIAVGNSNVAIRVLRDSALSGFFQTECYAEGSKIVTIKGKA